MHKEGFKRKSQRKGEKEKGKKKMTLSEKGVIVIIHIDLKINLLGTKGGSKRRKGQKKKKEKEKKKRQ